MSAELNRATGAEIWTPWENQVVNGVFPLRRLLGCASHGAVFLTEHKSTGTANAAIKFVRADALHAKTQLEQWQATVALSHPHLVRLFEIGRYKQGSHEFLFVVMEHAEQTLAQILRRRALSAEEVREMLLPALDALTFLHRAHLVHGGLKPSNLMAVDDRLKLASDTVRPIGHAASRNESSSSYPPPEQKDRGSYSAGDMWCLGMTLAEALAERTTGWSDRREMASLAATLPAPFADTVRRCLSLDPADRPTAAQLEAQYKSPVHAGAVSDPPQPIQRHALEAPPPPTKSVVPATSPGSPQSAAREAPPLTTATKRRPIAATAIAVVATLVLAVSAGSRLLDTSQANLQPAADAGPGPGGSSVIEKFAASNSEVPSSVTRPPTRPSPSPTAASLSAVHEVIPSVPAAIQAKIKGRIYVTVRVLVDPSGDVMAALMEDPGPSKYFARLADTAARQWQFAPADTQRPRVWLLRFQFTSGGAAARAIAQ